MAINFDPLSQFNFEPSSFSLPAGMNMNQAATTNAMMQPVPILGQQSVSAPQSNFRPVTEADLVGTDGMSASEIVDMINQPDYQTPSLLVQRQPLLFLVEHLNWLGLDHPEVCYTEVLIY